MSPFGVREITNPLRFVQLIGGSAKYQFLRKPASAIAEMHSGVPEQHKPFWNKMGSVVLYSVYQALQVAKSKVLAMVDNDIEVSNPNEEQVFEYLQQFIGDMQTMELRAFLRFLTGSSVCSAQVLQSQEGIARRPFGHTCSNMRELLLS